MKLVNLILAIFLCNIVTSQERHENPDSIQLNHSMHQHHQTSTNEWSSERPDGHAPISIMGDHLHHKGGWMFTYRFMSMQMKGLQKDGTVINNMEAHANGYMGIPLEMNMNMHMLGIMYAPSDRFTLMIMANYLSNEMDLQMLNMQNNMIMPFSTSSAGFGDVKVSGQFKIFNKNKQAMHGTVGLSFPTGSINQTDITPISSGNKVILPYPMQIGSGTIDTKLGMTYLGQNNNISWGSQLNGIIRVGLNEKDYRLGNVLEFNNWLAYRTTDWLSFSSRLEALVIDGIHGANSDLNPKMVTTADTANSGGRLINLGLGFNTLVPKGKLKDFRLAFEYKLPLIQSLNGIQLENKGSFIFGLQYAFH